MMFRKKPVVVEAVRWTEDNFDEIKNLYNDKGDPNLEAPHLSPFGALVIDTKEGTMVAAKGDFVICGVAGELYPCKPDIFERSYEAVS